MAVPIAIRMIAAPIVNLLKILTVLPSTRPPMIPTTCIMDETVPAVEASPIPFLSMYIAMFVLNVATKDTCDQAERSEVNHTSGNAGFCFFCLLNHLALRHCQKYNNNDRNTDQEYKVSSCPACHCRKETAAFCDDRAADTYEDRLKSHHT